MDELQSSQYAVQIACYTLRDRCRNLQQRVALLEEENINLRIQCSRQDESKTSLQEIDYLRAQVAEFSEQKVQMQDRVNMVTKENQDLWSKLGKLIKANKSLGSQLTKINNTITEHIVTPTSPGQQSNLIRSKTFTKNELQTKVLQKKLEENDRISLELEDISLKLSDSFSKQKQEINLLCSEYTDLNISCDGFSTDNCAYLLDDELDDNIGELQTFSDDLKSLREMLIQQQRLLVENLKNREKFKEKLKSEHQKVVPKIEKSTSTQDLQQKMYENKSTETERIVKLPESPARKPADNTNCEKICPMCSWMFDNVDNSTFEKHVEDHFSYEQDGFEML